MCDIVIGTVAKTKSMQAASSKLRHSSAGSTRVAYNSLEHLFAQKDAELFNESVFYTNRLVSCTCPHSVHDVLEQSIKKLNQSKITTQVVHVCLQRHGVTITSLLEQRIKTQLNISTDRHVSKMDRKVWSEGFDKGVLVKLRLHNESFS